jgi:hypothetical protein
MPAAEAHIPNFPVTSIYRFHRAASTAAFTAPTGSEALVVTW